MIVAKDELDKVISFLEESERPELVDIVCKLDCLLERDVSIEETIREVAKMAARETLRLMSQPENYREIIDVVVEDIVQTEWAGEVFAIQVDPTYAKQFGVSCSCNNDIFEITRLHFSSPPDGIECICSCGAVVFEDLSCIEEEGEEIEDAPL